MITLEKADFIGLFTETTNSLNTFKGKAVRLKERDQPSEEFVAIINFFDAIKGKLDQGTLEELFNLLKGVKGHIVSTLKKLALIDFVAVEDQPVNIIQDNTVLLQELEDLRDELTRRNKDNTSVRSENSELKAKLVEAERKIKELEAGLQSLRSKMFLKESSQIKEAQKKSSDLEKKNSDLEKKLLKLTSDEVARKHEKQVVERQGEPKLDKAEAKKIIEDCVNKVKKSQEHYTKKMESLKTELDKNDGFKEKYVESQK